MFNFSEKVVLAVGGAGYLCSPVCEGFAEQGAHVVVTDLDEERAVKFAGELAARHGVKAVGLAFDISDEEAIKSLIDSVMGQFGRLDVLVNAAYKGSHGKSVDDMLSADFDIAARVQLAHTFLLTREAAEVMKEGSSIVHFSSMYGSISPDPDMYHEPMKPNPIDYGITKAGLEQMIRYMAVHYAPRGIRINGVAPGAFPHAGALGSDRADFQYFLERLAAKAPMKRIGRQGELAGPVVFLASEEASFVTGQTLAVDGGWTIW